MGTLYEAAEKAITALFSDRSVSARVTLGELEELASMIETYIEALQSDIERDLESE